MLKDRSPTTKFNRGYNSLLQNWLPVAGAKSLLVVDGAPATGNMLPVAGAPVTCAHLPLVKDATSGECNYEPATGSVALVKKITLPRQHFLPAMATFCA